MSKKVPAPCRHFLPPILLQSSGAVWGGLPGVTASDFFKKRIEWDLNI
jgi:hypothetical protein